MLFKKIDLCCGRSKQALGFRGRKQLLVSGHVCVWVVILSCIGVESAGRQTRLFRPGLYNEDPYKRFTGNIDRITARNKDNTARKTKVKN